MFGKPQDPNQGAAPRPAGAPAPGRPAPRPQPGPGGAPAPKGAAAPRPAPAAPRQAPPAAGPAPAAPRARPAGAAPRPMGGERGNFTGQPDNGRLTVGQEIKMSGEIKSCDRLVVEGTVEANLSDSRALEVTETGVFRGSAEIDMAEINGVFEGDLNVEGRLFVRAQGRVSGTIRYGELEIERGGRVTGEIGNQADMSSPSSDYRRAYSDDNH